MKIIVCEEVTVMHHRLIGTYGFWCLWLAWRRLKKLYGARLLWKVVG